jgi:site-specific recombinase XerD
MKMERTSVPGIYLRGTKYIITYRDSEGIQRKESFPTLKEAKIEKGKRAAQISEGTYQPETHQTLHQWIDYWLEHHDGIRDNTRNDYRDSLKLAKEFFSPRVKLTAVTPKAVADYVAWLKGKNYAASSIAKHVAPFRTMFSTAREQGLVRHNPAQGVRLPRQQVIVTDDDHEDTEVKVFSEAQLAQILSTVRMPLLFELLACTGLRISEALALEWRHITLNGDSPHVKVRRGIVRGEIGPPKSKYGRRVVPLPLSIVRGLRSVARPQDALVFPSAADTHLKSNNLRERILQPALDDAGCGWASFHTFRHTFASMHISRGTNLVALSRVMGHHSASFTLKVYGHLLEGDEAPALELPVPVVFTERGRLNVASLMTTSEAREYDVMSVTTEAEFADAASVREGRWLDR